MARRSRENPPSDPGGGWAARINHTATGLTALAAVAALVFTGISSLQAQDELANRRRELDITQEGQVTDRFTAAVGQLGDASPDVRLGGIYALERIMRDSPGDQRSVVGVLSAYVRAHCPKGKAGATATESGIDVSAAVTAIASRRTGHDDEELVDWSGCLITNTMPENAYLASADLSGTRFSHLDLVDANLSGADLSGATFDAVGLGSVNFSEASLTGVDMTMKERPGETALFAPLNFSGADLTGANFAGLTFGGFDFSDADLTDANLSKVEVIGPDSVQGASRQTDFTEATLDNTKLAGADLREAKGLTVDQLLPAYFTASTRLPPALADYEYFKTLGSTTPWKPTTEG